MGSKAVTPRSARESPTDPSDRRQQDVDSSLDRPPSDPSDHGLAAAMRRGDTATAARIVDELGVDLAHTGHARLVYEAAATLPLELAAGRPGLAFRFEDIGRLPIGSTPLRLPETAEQAHAEVARTGDLRLRQALVPLNTRRRLAHHEDAVALVRAAEPLARACTYPLYANGGRITPYWYLQAGVTAQHAGDLHGAHRYLRTAWAYRSQEPYGFVARAIAAHLALLEALLGDHVAGATWLARARRERRRPDLWTDHFVESQLGAASAIQSVDSLDPAAEGRLRAGTHPSERTGLWPVLVWVLAQEALTAGDPGRARRHLEGALASRSPDSGRSGLAATLLPLVRGQILLAGGHGQQALAEIADVEDFAGSTRTLRARIHLLAGDASEALAIAREVALDGAAAVRARTGALLVAAAAQLALDERDLAIGDLHRAVVRVVEQDSPRLLATVPRACLHELKADVPALGPLLSRLDEHGIDETYPERAPFVTLTDRERVLLHDLGSGQTLQEIAKAHFVSVNTIRTHLANLRRKLGARSRHEVFVKARLLGLLDHSGEPTSRRPARGRRARRTSG